MVTTSNRGDHENKRHTKQTFQAIFLSPPLLRPPSLLLQHAKTQTHPIFKSIQLDTYKRIGLTVFISETSCTRTPSVYATPFNMLPKEQTTNCACRSSKPHQNKKLSKIENGRTEISKLRKNRQLATNAQNTGP